MSLDFYLESEPEEQICTCKCGNRHLTKTRRTFFSANITHNLGPMFNEAGAYHDLWRGDSVIARDALPRLKQALTELEAYPEKYKKFNSPNGWGLYENAVPWLKSVVQACEEYPFAKIRSCT